MNRCKDCLDSIVEEAALSFRDGAVFFCGALENAHRLESLCYSALKPGLTHRQDCPCYYQIQRGVVAWAILPVCIHPTTERASGGDVCL